MADATAVRKSRGLFWWAAALQAGCAIGFIVATALGMRFPLPIWLMFISGCVGFASNAVQLTRPVAGKDLLFAAALISIASVIVLLVTLP